MGFGEGFVSPWMLVFLCSAVVQIFLRVSSFMRAQVWFLISKQPFSLSGAATLSSLGMCSSLSAAKRALLPKGLCLRHLHERGWTRVGEDAVRPQQAAVSWFATMSHKLRAFLISRDFARYFELLRGISIYNKRAQGERPKRTCGRVIGVAPQTVCFLITFWFDAVFSLSCNRISRFHNFSPSNMAMGQISGLQYVSTVAKRHAMVFGLRKDQWQP